jgi:hypothetical protein
VGFEGAKMVVELLARNMEASGEHGGGGRFGKLGEDASTAGVEGHSGGGGVVDDFDREHGEIRALTIFIVKRFVSRKYGTGVNACLRIRRVDVGTGRNAYAT